MARGGFFSVDSLNGVHIVLVGQEPVSRSLLASILQYCGALVTAVTSAEEAFEVMRRVQADVLVAVLRGADDVAIGLIRDMRTRKPEDGGVMPAVALTPWSNALRPEQARAAGFDASITMPVNPWALSRLVAGLVTVGGR